MRSTLLLFALSPLALAQAPTSTSTSTLTSWWTATSTRTVFRVNAAATALSNTLTENVNGAASSSNAITEAVAANATASASSAVITEAVAGSNSSTVLTELIGSATGAAGMIGASSAVTVAVQGQGSGAPFQMPNATVSGLQFGVKGTGTGATPARFTGAAVRANSVSAFGGFAAVVIGAAGVILL